MPTLQFGARLFGTLGGGLARGQQLPLLEHQAAQLEEVLGLPRQQFESFHLCGGQMPGNHVGDAQRAQRMTIRAQQRCAGIETRRLPAEAAPPGGGNRIDIEIVDHQRAPGLVDRVVAQRQFARHLRLVDADLRLEPDAVAIDERDRRGRNAA